MDTPIEKRVENVLENAISYVREGWIQGDMAENEFGDSVGALDPSATRWCVIGAITVAGGRDIDMQTDTPGLRALKELEHSVGGSIITEWNDACDRSIEDVVNLLQTTLQRVRDHS